MTNDHLYFKDLIIMTSIAGLSVRILFLAFVLKQTKKRPPSLQDRLWSGIIK